MNGVMGFDEFKSFCDTIGRSMKIEEFQNEIMKKCQSTDRNGIGGEQGITVQGLKDFFYNELTLLLRQTGK